MAGRGAVVGCRARGVRSGLERRCRALPRIVGGEAGVRPWHRDLRCGLDQSRAEPGREHLERPVLALLPGHLYRGGR